MSEHIRETNEADEPSDDKLEVAGQELHAEGAGLPDGEATSSRSSHDESTDESG